MAYLAGLRKLISGNYCLTWNEGMLRRLKRSKFMYGFQHCFVFTVVPDVLETQCTNSDVIFN